MDRAKGLRVIEGASNERTGKLECADTRQQKRKPALPSWQVRLRASSLVHPDRLSWRSAFLKRTGSILLLGVSLSLSACATTARMHSQAEINGITRQCGLALGELFQDESEKRLLFMMRHGATAEERACVLKFARERHLRLVYVNAAMDPAN